MHTEVAGSIVVSAKRLIALDKEEGVAAKRLLLKQQEVAAVGNKVSLTLNKAFDGCLTHLKRCHDVSVGELTRTISVSDNKLSIVIVVKRLHENISSENKRARARNILEGHLKELAATNLSKIPYTLSIEIES